MLHFNEVFCASAATNPISHLELECLQLTTCIKDYQSIHSLEECKLGLEVMITRLFAKATFSISSLTHSDFWVTFLTYEVQNRRLRKARAPHVSSACRFRFRCLSEFISRHEKKGTEIEVKDDFV